MELTFEKIRNFKKLKGSIINTPFVKANKLSSSLTQIFFLN